jgi:hypothetical protein
MIEENEEKNLKKRGRKPKGGKIIQQTILIEDKKQKINVILHLKCTSKDLIKKDVPIENNDVDTNYPLQIRNNDVNVIKKNNKELKELEKMLRNNICNNKNSACFWCTCHFETTPVYIPKIFFKNAYETYGNFCMPECSVAFLMNENIDCSVKFERYQLIHHVYSSIYNYTLPIKPAPSPFYTLDKYFGTLSIEKYRDIFHGNNEKSYVITNKPLTTVLCDLHQMNESLLK